MPKYIITFYDRENNEEFEVKIKADNLHEARELAKDAVENTYVKSVREK